MLTGPTGGQAYEPIPDPHVPQTEGSQIGDGRLSTSCGGSLSGLITIVVMTLLMGCRWRAVLRRVHSRGKILFMGVCQRFSSHVYR